MASEVPVNTFGRNKVRERKIPLTLEGAEARIIYHKFQEFEVKTLLVSFDDKRRSISTMEGFKEVRFVGNHYEPPELWEYLHQHFEEYRGWLPSSLGLPFEESAFLFTGVDMDNLTTAEESFEEFKVCCLATAGVKSNAMRIGVDRAGSVEREGKFERLPGTVNIVLLTNAALTDGALARAIITVTEAKTSVLQDLDIRSSYNPEVQATGTGTDNIVVVSGQGPSVRYVGGHSKMGELVAETTYRAVTEAVGKQNGLFPGRPLEERLKERGIGLEELVEAGMEMYIPDPEIGGRKEVSSRLMHEISRALKDPNICSLILAGMKLEEEGRKGSIPGLSSEEYGKDPVHLIADEILGIQIATYIAGSRALFEFERFDRKKPGVLGKLPPILDDVIGGLISGCLVKVCSST